MSFCVSGLSAVNEIIQDDAVAGALAGKLLCQLSNGSDAEATELGERLSGLGVSCLFGSILGMPSDIERRQGTIVCSGPRDLHDQAEQVLATLGDVIYAGSCPGAAYTFAQLTYPANFGLTLGFLHGAAMADSLGISLEAYTDLCISRLPGLKERLRGFAPLLEAKDFAPHQARLEIWGAAFARYLELSREQMVDDAFPAALMAILQDTIDQGHRDSDLTSVFATFNQHTKSSLGEGGPAKS